MHTSQTELSNIRRPPPPPPPPSSLPVSPNRKPIETVTGGVDHETIVQDLCCRMIKAPGETNPPAALISLCNHCDPVIQSGPTCGLVALIMCLKLVDQKIQIDLATILDKAQSHGYTKFGEMFSAKNMHDFIRGEFSLRCDLKANLDRSMVDVVRHLCQGLPVLVPYDADANYEPCLRDGTRAHWAILCGFCILASSPINESLIVEKTVKLCNESNTTLLHLHAKNWRETFEFTKRHLILDRLWVYARQGKSPRLQLWNFRRLCQSNQNLNQISSKILKDPERAKMIYPDDGKLHECLSNRFLLLYR